ncbi:MAG: tRNA (guanine(10)-N(2))-dimethyltransferase [Thermoproteales archaeon]|nr:tRNA (guanine(10)-N(2))-dimethyltransferase [Thermoproteales archaeon]RLE65871.1 MAG: tRNA (guanine(10)-N(2))-dimethyltransferase [Thermoprotei archaeon]
MHNNSMYTYGEINFPLEIINEGHARIMVPRLEAFSRNGVVEPAWAPVFYNPKAKFSRDISILFLYTYFKHILPPKNGRGIKIIEPLSATGVRGLRYILEVPFVEKVFLNDKNPLAFKLIKVNSQLNKVHEKVFIGNEDANIFMYGVLSREGHVDVVDIDPFGSSTPFLDTALRLVRNNGIVCLTFTDVAVPYGVYPLTCLRRYSAFSFRVPFSPETALRILLGHLCREALKFDYGIEPLLAFYVDYYVRIFARVIKKIQVANKSLEKLAYVGYCTKCGFRMQVNYLTAKHGMVSYCDLCGHKIRYIGPLWGGRYLDKKLIEFMLMENEKQRYGDSRLDKLLKTLYNELDEVPFYYNVGEFAKMFKMNEKSPTKYVKIFREKGYKASLTHLDSKGFKVHAEYPIILEEAKKVE